MIIKELLENLKNELKKELLAGNFTFGENKYSNYIEIEKLRFDIFILPQEESANLDPFQKFAFFLENGEDKIFYQLLIKKGYKSEEGKKQEAIKQVKSLIVEFNLDFNNL